MMDINDIIIQNKCKKRGRPRKNIMTRDAPKNNSNKKIEAVEDDIIIHFPISSAELKNEKINGCEIIQTECQDVENNDTTDTSCNDDVETKSTKQLVKIIEEQDKIINNLKKKLEKYDTSLNNEIDTKYKIKIIDCNLGKNKDGTIIIPENTQLSCLWDTCKINGTPCFLPEKLIDNTFYVDGCFCSLNCAMAYNFSLCDGKVSERNSMLRCLYKRIQDNIEPSPTPRILTKFGGNIDIAEYRKNLIQCDKEYRLIAPPMAYICNTLEERLRDTQTQNRNSIMDVIKQKK